MKTLFILSFVVPAFFTFSQLTFSTNGNKIIDPCGNEFTMKGVNYSLSDDWNFPGNLNNGKELSAQIIQANPNTVRIQWYADYGQPTRPALTLESLDSVISRFYRANIVTVLELHDYTHIHTDTTGFNNDIVGWWTSAPVLQLIEKHRKNIIVNVANEYGPSMWISGNVNPNYAAEIVTWRKHYKSVISQLRSAGIKVPLMIDAPQYGMDHETVIAVASEFNDSDPMHNIIMSCHAYWDESAASIEAKVNSLSNLTVPVVMGEVGNNGFGCVNLPLSALLQVCKDKNIGWMAWTWNRDGDCEDRNMTMNDYTWNSTNDGLFSTLTPYGQLIVNNSSFGLANHAVKAEMSCALDIEEASMIRTFYPNPLQEELIIELSGNLQLNAVSVINGSGQECLNYSTSISGSKLAVDVRNLERGIYFVKLTLDRGQTQVIKVVK